jgi:hypothetical protein
VLTATMGVQAYDALKKHGWYRPDKLGIKWPVSMEMEREANLALGTWYQNSRRQEQMRSYVDKVQQLVSSSDYRDRRNAFHMIRHTQPTRKQKGVHVETVFHPMLRTLFLDPAVKKTVNRFYEMFQINLSRFRELEVQRQRL